MDFKALADDDIIIDWFDTVAASKGTQKSYLNSMQKYTDFRQMTPEEIFDEAIEQLEASGLKAKWKFPKKINSFKRFLKEGGYYGVHQYNQDPNDPSKAKREFQKPLALTTVDSHIGAIRSFYLSYDIELPNKKGADRNRGQPLNANMEVFDKKKLKWILENLKTDNTIRDTAIVLCGSSSGLGLSELLKLRVRDVLDIDHNNVTMIEFMREDSRTKTSVEFHTFFSPEATTWLWKYIADRGLSKDYVGDIPNPERFMRYTRGVLDGKRRKEWEVKHNINCDDDFLFANANVNSIYLNGGRYVKGSVDITFEGYKGTFNEELERRFRQMSSDGLMSIFNRISENMDIASEKGNFNPFRTHNLRKFFITTLEDENVSSRNIDYMAGKKIPESKSTYIRGRNLDKLRAVYTEACPELSLLTKTVHLTMDEAIKKVKMEYEIENLKLQRDIEIKPVQQGIEDLKNKIKRADEINDKPSKNVLSKMLRENEPNLQRLKEKHEAKIAEMQSKYDELYGHLS